MKQTETYWKILGALSSLYFDGLHDSIIYFSIQYFDVLYQTLII